MPVIHTRDDLKRYLSSYQDIMLEVEALEYSVQGLHSPSISAEPKGSSRTMIQRYNSTIAKIDKKMEQANEIADFIDTHFDGKERVIMYYAYIEGMSMIEIAIRLHLSLSTVCKRHTHALDACVYELNSHV